MVLNLKLCKKVNDYLMCNSLRNCTNNNNNNRMHSITFEEVYLLKILKLQKNTNHIQCVPDKHVL